MKRQNRRVDGRLGGKGATRSQRSGRRIDSTGPLSRIRRGVISVLLVCFFAGVGYGAVQAAPYVNPNVQQISIEGDFQWLDQGLLEFTVQQNLSGGILTLDIDRLSLKVGAIAWVETVEIVKQLPTTLIVQLSEEKPIAQWNTQGYISNQGEFIESPLHVQLNYLPKLSSAMSGRDTDLAREALDIFHLLNSVVLASGQNVKSLIQSEIGGWIMTWDNGVSIDLGRVDHLNRIRHAMATWQRLPEEMKGKLNRIDARYDNGVAVRIESESSASVVRNNSRNGALYRTEQRAEQSVSTSLNKRVEKSAEQSTITHFLDKSA